MRATGEGLTSKHVCRAGIAAKDATVPTGMALEEADATAVSVTHALDAEPGGSRSAE